jgi:hypothetical protein
VATGGTGTRWPIEDDASQQPIEEEAAESPRQSRQPEMRKLETEEEAADVARAAPSGQAKSPVDHRREEVAVGKKVQGVVVGEEKQT